MQCSLKTYIARIADAVQCHKSLRLLRKGVSKSYQMLWLCSPSPTVALVSYWDKLIAQHGNPMC